MTVTLLEMTERPSLSITPPYRGGMLVRADEIGPSFYRYLGEASGRPRVWRRRSGLTDAELAEALSRVEVTVLYLGGTPAGWFEIAPGDGEVEVGFAGVLLEFAGRGLERRLVAAAVEAAWEHEPAVVTAAGDEQDPPTLLLEFQRAGFQVVEVPG